MKNARNELNKMLSRKGQYNTLEVAWFVRDNFDAHGKEINFLKQHVKTFLDGRSKEGRRAKQIINNLISYKNKHDTSAGSK